jgi:hypothetical protein
MATGKKKDASLTPLDDARGITVTVKLPDIVVEIIEVSWKSGIDSARAKTKISAPHWKVGEKVEEEDKPDLMHYKTGSQKPGVYLVNSKKGVDTFEVKIKVTKNTTDKTTGKLSGKLGSLSFEGDCALGVGTHTVPMKFGKLPDALTHAEGDATWQLASKELTIPVTTKTRLEVFVVFDKPMAFYTDGVWAEALRFVFKKAGVAGSSKPEDAAKKITTYCHTGHGMTYDTVRGGSYFGGASAIDGGVFNLTSYIQKIPTKAGHNGLIVNCYDQSASVQTLCGAVGIKMDSLYQEPFGPIKRTNLVGVGPCNNPFFNSNASTPLVADDSSKRTSFGNHAFPRHISKIHDSCAGPHVGTEDLRQYLVASIDAKRLIVEYNLGSVKEDAVYDFLVNKNIAMTGIAGVI